MAGSCLDKGLQCDHVLPSGRNTCEVQVPTDSLGFDKLAGHLKSEYVAIKEADALLQSHRTRWLHHLEYWMRQQESFISEIKFGQPPTDIQDEELPPLWQRRLQAMPVHGAMDETGQDFATTSPFDVVSARGPRCSQRPEQLATLDAPVPEEDRESRLSHVDSVAEERRPQFDNDPSRSYPYAFDGARLIQASGDSCDSISLEGVVWQDKEEGPTRPAGTWSPDVGRLTTHSQQESLASRRRSLLDMIDASVMHMDSQSTMKSNDEISGPADFMSTLSGRSMEESSDLLGRRRSSLNSSVYESMDGRRRSSLNSSVYESMDGRRRVSWQSPSDPMAVRKTASTFSRRSSIEEPRGRDSYSSMRSSQAFANDEFHRNYNQGGRRSLVPLCSLTLGTPQGCLNEQEELWVHFVITMLIKCRKDLRPLRRSWVKREDFWKKALKVSSSSQRTLNIFGVQPGQSKVTKPQALTSRNSFQRDSRKSRSASFEDMRKTRMSRRDYGDLPQQMQEVEPKYRIIMNPTSAKRLSWVFMGMSLMLYDLIAFPLTVFDPAENNFTETMKYFSQTYWTLDVVISFITGVTINGELVMRPMKIAQQYAKTWLTFDCLVTFPLWIIIFLGLDSGSSSSVRSVRYVRMLRFLRLMRLAKFEHLMGEALEFVNSSTVILSFGIVKLMVYLTILNHFNACIWYAVGNQHQGWADPVYGHVAGRPIIYKYLCAMHWALTQFQGTSEILPGKTLGERLYAAAFLTLALMILALFVSSLTNLKMQLQGLQDERNRISRTIRAYLTGNKISTALSIHVKKYVDWKLRQVSERDNDQVLQILPKQLKMEVLYEVRGPALVLHRFFEMVDLYYSKVFRRICQEAVAPQAYAPTELIFSPNDDAKYTYFVTQGVLRYRLIRTADAQWSELDSDFMSSHVPSAFMAKGESKEQSTDYWTCQVLRGEWLSEATLWVDWEHCGHLQAMEDTLMFAMEPLEFEKAVTSHTQAHATAVLYARRFWTALNGYGKVYTDHISDPLFVDLDEPISVE